MRRCGFFRRQIHSRLRRMDQKAMFTAIVDRSTTIAEAIIAWEVFITMEGQEHWVCQCGLEPREKIVAAMTKLLKLAL